MRAGNRILKGLQLTAIQLINPCMYRQGLTCIPCLLDAVGLAQVFNLANDVQFTEAVKVCLLIEGGEAFGLFFSEFPHRLHPIVNHTKGFSVDGMLDATTAVMAAQDDVFYFEREDRVVENG